MKKLVVLTGAGMSAESGISTFRDANGLWEGHDIMEVASPEGFANNPQLVLDFYNKRRAQLKKVNPNLGHRNLKLLEQYFDVSIITQNVDDLHERSGSKKVMHLHGELRKVRSIVHQDTIYQWEDDLNLGDVCENNTQLRPHIVWFGEDVPMIEKAVLEVEKADILVIIGTSMQVYPAAGLVNYTKANTPVYFIDPNPAIRQYDYNNLSIIKAGASEGTTKLIQLLTE